MLSISILVFQDIFTIINTFLDLCLKSYKFVITKKKIIRFDEIDIVYLPTCTGTIIAFNNIASIS